MSINYGYHIKQEIITPYKKITVIPIKSSYLENLTSNYLKMPIDDYVKILNHNKQIFNRKVITIMNIPKKFGDRTKIIKSVSKINFNVSDFSFYEVLQRNHYLKIFLDVENIPMEESEIINYIIRDFKIFTKESANVDIELLALTLNTNSMSHEGRSYHVIFNLCTEIFNMKNMIYWFLKKFPCYLKFVDSTVYSRNRLFKSINQININQNTRSNSNDKHDLIKGTIYDSIIQNIKNIMTLGFEYSTVKIKQSKKKFSKDKPKDEDLIEPNIHDSVDEVILKHKPTATTIITDEEIKGLIIGAEMKELNQKQQNFINDLKLYFEQHNTFDNYKYSRECLKSILNTIH